ncbi:unnamed protein product [Dimorphilus gyrociliatus]|uniref:Uncharacterized protein n=1 Tax=Dimorphilus gyrociliatus TaxID=2664684 RepID=A0A7I8V3E5_9ANNE|nr:unnamed protein product [Dimorphilus gyrociliatus]
MLRNTLTGNKSKLIRAQRQNKLESIRLDQSLIQIEKEKVKAIQTVNRNIRMLNVTLEYIRISTGRSPHGLCPELIIADSEKEIEPVFVYGERKLSRRFGKNRPHTTHRITLRPRSADGRERTRPKTSPANRTDI